MNQTRIMSIQTSISISNEKIKFFCESYDKKKNNNSVQNNHRRFSRCRFKIFLAQTFCQVWAFNFSWSVLFSSISYWYWCFWLCFRSLQFDRSNLWSFESWIDVVFQIKTITRLRWRYFIYCHACHLFQYSNKKTQAIHRFYVHCKSRRSWNHFKQIMNESMWFVVDHEEWQFDLFLKNFVSLNRIVKQRNHQFKRV